MFKRNCPKCGKDIFHNNEYNLKRSLKSNRPCRSCSHTKNIGPFIRQCPDCGKETSYSNKGSLKRAEKNNGKCDSCCKRGIKRGPHSEEHRRNLSLARGGNGVLNKDKFNHSRLRQWANDVRERDDYICQHCLHVAVPGDGTLEAHHIVKKSKFPQYAYDLDNGISLCKTCHMYEHKHYG